MTNWWPQVAPIRETPTTRKIRNLQYIPEFVFILKDQFKLSLLQEIEKGQQSQFVAHEKISHGDPSLQVLPDIVKQVMYLPDNDYIISSTSSALQSLVISPADRKDFKRSYVFNIDKVMKMQTMPKDRLW